MTTNIQGVVVNSAIQDPMEMSDPLLIAIRDYWNDHIHDLEITTEPIGSRGFFDQLDEYRFDKLRYLPELVDFNGFKGRKLLEIGCGLGIDLARFAQGEADVIGIDLAEVAIDLAKENFSQLGQEADLLVMNGEALEFTDESFDVVYAHGVVQYTAHAEQMISEIARVLKPAGEAIIMVYNRNSWLNVMSKLMKVELEHEDAPVLNMYSAGEFRKLLAPFSKVSLITERFPVETKLHKGFKAEIYNKGFVKIFSLLPKFTIRSLGWHLMAFAAK